MCVSGTYGRNELVYFLMVFDALQRFALGINGFYAGADVNRQAAATRPHGRNAIGYVCSSKPTT